MVEGERVSNLSEMSDEIEPLVERLESILAAPGGKQVEFTPADLERFILLGARVAKLTDVMQAVCEIMVMAMMTGGED